MGILMTIITNIWHLDREARERKQLNVDLKFIQTISIVATSSLHFVKTGTTQFNNLC